MHQWLQGGLIGLGVGAAAALATYSYANLFARHRLSVEHVTVPISNLPIDLHGCKIVHLSDFHHTRGAALSLIGRAVRQANLLKPDLIALTGDFITHEPDAVSELVPLLQQLRAPLGVFAVLGNHDFNHGESALRSGLRQAGITLLVNSGVYVEKGESKLYVAGVDECAWGEPDLALALEGVEEETAVILLAHQPDFADKFTQDGRVSLQLSGHTHGGQIRLPGIGPLVLPSHGKKYHTGLYKVGGMWVYTNRGIGVNGLPVRLNCSPEVTEICLGNPDFFN